MVLSTRDDECWCEKVSGLIDPQRLEWKDSLLYELFDQQEIENIKAIPLSTGGREDRLVWELTNNGLYTVKSGYHLSKKLDRESEGETSDRNKNKLIWKSIWKLDTTPKTKMLIWWACNEALPTQANLKKRKIVEDNSSKDVWNQGGEKVQKMSHHSDFFFDIWSITVASIDPPDLTEIAITTRRIWTRRNEFIHGKGLKHPTCVYQQAKTEMTDYMEALKEPTTSNGKAPAKTPTWSRPDAEGFKVNWDSAINLREGKIGIGVLIRDHQGRVIGALHANRPLKGSSFDAEAYGVLLAAIFCRDLGLKSIYLEGDAKQVVDLLKNHKLNWSLGGCLIGDAR
ncbi:uncharacterized protein LOC122296834 [Carya illinoinensis]|uniref:uncharacterized protein LOC122296834 n=1 Tax=Carya illinoinensis TaxID=32201 RepID=UPI001C726A91|nr:uncharacterized protein LOC122296834 [Carya illinoinensis]